MTNDLAAVVRYSQPRTLPHDTLGTPDGRHLVAIDIDGTTLAHDGTLSARVRDTVRATVHAGHEVVVATGRSVLAAAPVLADLGLSRGYAVCSNGAVVLRLDPQEPTGWAVVEEATFDPAPALSLLRERFRTGGLAVERVGVGFDVHGDFPPGELEGEVHSVSWAHLADRPTTRVVFFDPGADVEHFADHVDALGLHGVNYAVGFTAWLDITADGVSKASGLDTVRTLLDVDASRTVAVGDQRNDVEMLRWAACGVAMGNAPDEVAAAADYVTDSVHADGLAEVLDLLTSVT